MCLADGATQALGGLRDNDQVNMIGYQAICPDRDLLCAAELRHALEVVRVVFLTEECLLSGVPSLGDVVGHAMGEEAGRMGEEAGRVRYC
jgi:hypothetical protein